MNNEICDENEWMKPHQLSRYWPNHNRSSLTEDLIDVGAQSFDFVRDEIQRHERGRKSRWLGCVVELLLGQSIDDGHQFRQRHCYSIDIWQKGINLFGIQGFF